MTEVRELIRIPVEDAVVGDVMSVNTGYRPLDDEDCEILSITPGTGLFSEEEFIFSIKSAAYGIHDTVVDAGCVVYVVKR
jgi:hypothetical protein